jgi:hypothetical protein
MLLCGLSSMDTYQPGSFKQLLLEAVAARLPQQQQQQLSKRQLRKQQQGVSGTPQDADSSSSRDGSSDESPGVFQVESLPYVLLDLRRLWVTVPADVLCSTEAALRQQLQDLPLPTLCPGLFSLAASKHTADTAFLAAALSRIDAQLQECSGLDVAHVLFALAMMSGWGGDLRQALQQQEQQQQLQRLVDRAQQVGLWCWGVGFVEIELSPKSQRKSHGRARGGRMAGRGQGSQDI